MLCTVSGRRDALALNRSHCELLGAAAGRRRHDDHTRGWQGDRQPGGIYVHGRWRANRWRWDANLSIEWPMDRRSASDLLHTGPAQQRKCVRGLRGRPLPAEHWSGLVHRLHSGSVFNQRKHFMHELCSGTVLWYWHRLCGLRGRPLPAEHWPGLVHILHSRSVFDQWQCLLKLRRRQVLEQRRRVHRLRGESLLRQRKQLMHELCCRPVLEQREQLVLKLRSRQVL